MTQPICGVKERSKNAYASHQQWLAYVGWLDGGQQQGRWRKEEGMGLRSQEEVPGKLSGWETS